MEADNMEAVNIGVLNNNLLNDTLYCNSESFDVHVSVDLITKYRTTNPWFKINHRLICKAQTNAFGENVERIIFVVPSKAIFSFGMTGGKGFKIGRVVIEKNVLKEEAKENEMESEEI